jgi:trans-aconitate 2-methyltransferase
MNDWDPQQYLKFNDERTRPAADLVARIAFESPGTIIDIGCGPGNSTRILRDRWPAADITGIDYSPNMIEKARADYPGLKWEVRDATNFNPGLRFDIVFSNAALQWVPDHDMLMPHLFSMVSDKGLLAIQMPANNESPFYKIMVGTACSGKWREFTSGCEKLLTYHSAGYYYDLLSPIAGGIDVWTATYYHVMKSHRDLTEWHKSTGMKPYLESLPDEARRAEFEKEIISNCEEAYPVQKDGRILYPFRRLFIIATKR